jgi:hypothetical protein
LIEAEESSMRSLTYLAGAFLAAASAGAAHGAVVAHWSFDSGTLSNDGTNITAVGEQTGNHNASPGTGGTGGTTGTSFVSAAFPLATSSVAGQHGQALRFAGNNFLLFNNLTELMAASGAPNYTVSMWVKTETNGGTIGSGFAHLSNWGNQPSTNTTPTRFTYSWGPATATQMRGQTRSQAASGVTGTDIYGRQITTGGTHNDANWHMYTWTFDTTSGALSSYFDGTLVETFTATAANKTMANSNSAVGGLGIKADSGAFLPAGVVMDEVWVFNQILTGPEVMLLRTTNAIPEPTSLALLGLGGLALAARRKRIV